MRTHVLFTATCLCLPVSAMAQDKATIQSLNDQFARAFNTGDIPAVAAHYTEDATVLPPGAEMVMGRDAILAFWKSAAEQIGDIKLTAVDVKPLGSNAAREIGTFSLRTKGSQSQEIAGKYVVVWEKVGADWKLATDIWNTIK
ncbi:YybH family protein [Microvirga splendida]|uniref:SgcJ/EcaC family oxidoreductase n=1 Tax=Microvirga splendida TaxID=2795727 RepID=A0ABS0Y7S2_9HYPH|nr:SgcJ/EcaC family oxidoreductase [Microvirga splendida]MBJ6128357.1 SgcJ/EcaC family oxidoreductase [Microvirga splendida]